MAESINDLKQLLKKVKEKSAGLSLNIKKAKIMARLKETMETLKLLPIFAYLGSVINSKRDCSQEIKRRLGLSKAAIEE